MPQEVVLPIKYLQRFNCEAPVGHFPLSCHFVPKGVYDDFVESLADTLTTDLLSVGNGTSALPSYTFTSDPNTGLYRASADTLGFATGGTQRATLSSSGLAVTNVVSANGSSAAAPSYAFTTDPDTGIFSSGTNQLGVAANGAAVATFGTGGLAVNVVSELTAASGVTVDGVLLKDGGAVLAHADVTQLTSITTTVVANGPAGTVTTVSSTIAADGSETFTVTNSFAVATSKIQLTASTAGTGIPVATVGTKGAGSFTIKLYNAHSSAAFNNTILIDYLIS